MPANLANVAKKAVSNPVGAAADLIGGALGLGKGANKLTYQRRQQAQIRNVKLAQDGDPIALAMLAAIGGIRGLPGVVSGSPYTWRGATLPMGWSSRTADWGKAYQNIIDRAANWYNSLKGSVKPWDGSAGSAPSAGPGSPPETSAPETSSPSSGSAPSAPKPPKPKPPCKYGPRGADGYCPKKPTSSQGSSFLGPGTGSSSKPPRAKPPCKYGPRGADGYCPKKPPSSRLSKRETAAINKAGRAAEKIVTDGLKGAGKAIAAGLAAEGVGLGAAAATVAAVAIAALGGWFMGRAIVDFSDRNSVAQVKANAAVRANHARKALAEKLGVYDENLPGVGLSAADQAGIKKAYNDSIAAIERAGRDTAYADRLKAAIAAGQDWRTVN